MDNRFINPSKHIYQFCPINDGLLYTEMPDFFPSDLSRGDLLTLLLQQRWRDLPHFRTASGYVPYSGGGIAFYALPLVLRGVKPLWWPAPTVSYKDAVNALLLETPYFKDELDAFRHLECQYQKECEWQGPAKMRFFLQDISYIWIGPLSLRRFPAELLIKTLRKFIPDNIPIYLEPPEKEPFPF